MNSAHGRIFKVGEIAQLKKTISESDVRHFAEISLDKNPAHLDAEYASKTFFKKPIAHGMLSVSLISAVLGTELPGEGAIYLSQTVNFLKPVFYNETITAWVEVISVEEKVNKHGTKDRVLTLKTWVQNAENVTVVAGEAKALVRG